MSPFTALESAVLAEIGRAYPNQAAALEKQLAGATLTSRKNSGVGFFTEFSVDPIAPVLEGESVLSGLQARITGLKHGMGFLLFVTNGRADMLEGYTYGGEDQTTDLDLEALEFDFD